MVRKLLHFIIIISYWASAVSGQSIDNPQQPEYLYIKRIEKLDQASPIKLEYNSYVRAYINVYTERRREHLSTIIARSELYFPLFEEYLAKYNLPLELKYLAIVESALDPRAKSSSGAMGLWQFLYNAGRMFGLNVTSYEDERCDPVKSTDAACRYLAYLYQNLNDWQLALAAYNGGIGEVQKAIERSGGKKNYWELRPYLSEQVRGYVPAFIAVNYVMNHYKSHNIKPATQQVMYAETDTVMIYRSLTFEQIAKAAGTTIEIVSLLNPSYTKEMIPAYGTPVPVRLPGNNIMQFVREEKNLATTAKPTGQTDVWRLRTPVTIRHTVVRGEFFHTIAMKYQTTVDQIMKWNNLKSKDLRAGQSLIIYQYPKPEPFFFIREEKT